ncbi:hypothetical protein [Nocardia gipuzkoensis]
MPYTADQLHRLLPMTVWWNTDGTLPEREAESAGLRARRFWGLTDPADISTAVHGYLQRMHHARQRFAFLREEIIAAAQESNSTFGSRTSPTRRTPGSTRPAGPSGSGAWPPGAERH